MKNHVIAICGIFAATLLAGCTPKPKPDPRQLSDAQVKELADLGASRFGVQWGKTLNGAGERGVAAVSDGVTTLTAHTGQRVFIVHNRKEYPPTAATAFQGSDED